MLKIDIYGPIGYKYYDWDSESYKGVTFEEIRKKVKNYKGDQIELFVHSDGGSVFEANAISSILRGHQAKVTANIVGNSFSAATIICTSADYVKISNTGFYMIHPVSADSRGTAKEHKAMVDLMEKLEDQIIDGYVAKTGLSREEIKNMMDAETWLTPQEAYEKGFVDEISDGVNISAHFKEEFINTAPTWVKNNFQNNFMAEHGTKGANPIEALTKKIDDFTNKFKGNNEAVKTATDLLNSVKTELGTFADFKNAFDNRLKNFEDKMSKIDDLENSYNEAISKANDQTEKATQLFNDLTEIKNAFETKQADLNEVAKELGMKMSKQNISNNGTQDVPGVEEAPIGTGEFRVRIKTK